MNKLFLGLILALVLAGCATTANYQQSLKQWQGARAQDLIRTWGYPDAAIKLPNSNTVYMYTQQRTYTTPLYPAPAFGVSGNAPYNMGLHNNLTGGQTMRLYCRTWFETNSQGIIVNIRFQGNNCVANKS